MRFKNNIVDEKSQVQVRDGYVIKRVPRGVVLRDIDETGNKINARTPISKHEKELAEAQAKIDFIRRRK